MSLIINKAKTLSDGVNPPFVTMFERVTGQKYNGSILHNHHTPTFPTFNNHKTVESLTQNNSLEINIFKEIMHNHSITIKSDNVYLCPMVAANELIDIEYEFHASNLPEPIVGKVNIKGTENISST